jgi:hypothetical protein
MARNYAQLDANTIRKQAQLHAQARQCHAIRLALVRRMWSSSGLLSEKGGTKNWSGLLLATLRPCRSSHASTATHLT